MKKQVKDKFLVEFGRRLVELRKQTGISQEQLSYDSEISLSSISKIERGVMNVSITNVYKLAQALKVDHRELFDFGI